MKLRTMLAGALAGLALIAAAVGAAAAQPRGVPQWLVDATTHGIPATIGASATVTGPAFEASNFRRGAVTVVSSHAGTLNVRRFLDAGGTIQAGATLTTSITTGVAALIVVDSSIPFVALQVEVVNAAAASAAVTPVVWLLGDPGCCAAP